MSESMLKKEFKEKDVQRLRNLVTKKYGAKTITQVGYKKPTINYKEGDVWEDDGKKWTIKDGVKQTISRLDTLKKINQLPLACPSCLSSLKPTNLNKKMYSIHGMCFDCVATFESKLKIEGKFKEYEQNIINKGIKIYIGELEDLLLELALNDSDESFVTEAGDIERWVGGAVDNKSMMEDIKEYINLLKETHVY